jgi:hypothetical protein
MPFERVSPELREIRNGFPGKGERVKVWYTFFEEGERGNSLTRYVNPSLQEVRCLKTMPRESTRPSSSLLDGKETQVGMSLSTVSATG